jgi:hypothetical protein
MITIGQTFYLSRSSECFRDLVLGICTFWIIGPAHSTERIEFARDIRPILAANCMRCHGRAEQQAGLRFDRREEALAELESGSRAIVPGGPEKSELITRVAATDEARMPPEGNPLSTEQIEILRKWIAGGAEWSEHWAYRPLRKPELPALTTAESNAWVRTPIDHFILQKLASTGLRPSPLSDRRALLRRVYFDLIGLPPSVEEIEEFLQDESPGAYEAVVDRLLASPHFGERWARHWMDVVHYADSHGFEHDLPRTSWPYRDYLIRVFNDDIPYDRFIREQIAGDVLFPGNNSALVATGFLATGPWDLSALQAGQMDTDDHKLSQYLDRDDMVSTVMSTSLSARQFTARAATITSSIPFRKRKSGEVQISIFLPTGTSMRETFIGEQLQLQGALVIVNNHGFQSIAGLQRWRTGNSFGNEFRARTPKTNRLEGDFLRIDFAKVAEGMGARTWNIDTPDGLRQALGEARKEQRSCVIVVEVNGTIRPPDSGLWWDFEVAEVSEDSTVQAIRKSFEKERLARRFLY